MSTQAPVSAPIHPLDKALFWLRWLFIISAAVLLLLAEKTVLGDDATHHDMLPIALGIAAAANVVLGGLILIPTLGERLLGALGIGLDGILAALFFWVYEGAAAPLLILGTLAVVAAAFRFGWRGVALALALLGVCSLVAVLQLGDLDDTHLVNWGLSLVFLLVFSILGLVLRSQSGGGRVTRSSLAEREAEAHRLRVTRERARALYTMAGSLSASLDYRRVLDAAQNVGVMILGDKENHARLVSAVLLFQQGKERQLRVVSSRGLPRVDETITLTGRRGVLGLALRQNEPIFAGEVVHDPELHYFVGLHNARSLLIIPLQAGFDTFGAIVFGSDQPNAFSDEHVELLKAIGTQVTLSLQNAVLYQKLRIEKDRIVEVEEDARKKLARDLHDGPTQIVAAIAMHASFIRRLVDRQPQQAIKELEKVEDMARRTTKEIRHMLFTLRPLVLESQGLIAALEQLAEKMRDTYNANVIVKGQPEVETLLDNHAQGVLFYIIEEATNNARKYAQSTQIWVRLYRRDAFVVIEIEDDGVGFDVAAVTTNYEKRGSLGMVNMKERAELVEGTLQIQSAKGKGTKITIVVPIHKEGGEISESAPPLALQAQRTGPTTPAPTASG